MKEGSWTKQNVPAVDWGAFLVQTKEKWIEEAKSVWGWIVGVNLNKKGEYTWPDKYYCASVIGTQKS